MQVRAIGYVLALGISTALVSPAQAQQTALPDLPTIGERLAPFKQSYDEIGELAELADEAHKLAAEKAFEAQTAYRDAFDEHSIAIEQARIDKERFKKAWDDADVAYRGSLTKELERQYPRGSEAAKRQAEAIAESQLLKAAAESAKAEYEAAKKYHLDLLTSDPVAGLLIKMGLERSEEKRAQENLANVEALLVKATQLYAQEMFKYPPPYLKRIEVGDGSSTYYAASWDAPSDAGEEQSGNRAELKSYETELLKDLTEMDAILASHSEERTFLAKSLSRDASIIRSQAKEIGNLAWYGAIAPIVVDSAAFALDILTTGGAATITSELSDKAFDEAVRRANSAAGAKLKSKADAAFATLLFNEEYGGNALGSFLDGLPAGLMGQSQSGLVEYVAGTTNNGSSILLSDLIEKSIASTEELGSPKQVWKVFKEGGGLKALGPKYLDAMKKGAPATIIASVTKIAINKYFADRMDQQQQDFFRANLSFEFTMRMFTRSLQNDRALIEMRKLVRAQLADVQFKLLLDGRSPVLTKRLDKGIPAKALRDGKLTIRAFFNQPMSVEPILKFGDDFLLDWKQIRERDGTQWIGTKLSGTGFEGENKVQLFVAASKGNDGHDALDGQPSTVPELDFLEAKWTNFEQLADGNHVVKIDHPKTDLTGLWRRSDGTLFRFTHTGSRLESDYASRPARFAHEIGGINFNGTIEGSRVTGRLLGRPQRVHYARCQLDMFENFSFALSDDLMTLSGTHGRSNYDTSNCRILSKGTMRTSYTRVLDEEGEPQR